MTTRSRNWFAVVLVLAIASMMSACMDRRSDEELANTLILGFSDNMKTFDPARQIYSQESAIIRQTTETLVRWHPTRVELEPALATHWETTDDCNSWTFYLRPNVLFHDGTPFTAIAVKMAIDRILDPATAASRRRLIQDVTEVEVVDDLTVRFHLSGPNCILPERLTSTFSAIPAPHTLGDPDGLATQPVGTGPFMLESWDQSAMILKFRRNPNYWAAERFHFDNLVLRQVREHTTRLILLEQGALDVIYVSFEHVLAARNLNNITLQSTPQFSVVYIGFNTQNPPFNDIRVRQACNYAVNKKDIVQYVFFGVGDPAQGPIPTQLPAFNHEMPQYDYDPDRARALLAEAGYPDGIDVVLWTTAHGPYNRVAESVVEYLRQVGVRVEIRAYDNAVYWDAISEYVTDAGDWFPDKEGVFDLFVGGWVGGEAPHGYIESLFRTNSPSNNAFFSHPRVDQLLEEYRVYTDIDQRNDAYREMQAIIMEQAPWIFVYYGQVNMATRNHVKGFKVNGSAQLYFHDVHLEVPGVSRL